MTASSSAYQNLHQLFIEGQWVAGESDRVNTDINPYDGETLLEIQQATRAQLDQAYQAALAAQKSWGKSLPQGRAELMMRVVQVLDSRAEEIISWIIRESGSTRLKATIELMSAKGIVLEAASFPSRMQGEILPSIFPGQSSRVYRAPLGVIGVISPWNFPFHLSMRSVAPALATGNTVVLKPASDTPVSGGTLLAAIFEEAGAPAGTMNVVVGAGSEIGDAFVEHEIPRFISFTGSTPVGQGIGRIATGGKSIKRVALELGGNAPIVVLDDADIEDAAAGAVAGRFLHQGQICMSTNRAIVDEKVHDQFVAAVEKRVKALKWGNPDLMENVIGPIINEKQLADVQGRIERALKDGAREIVGGEAEGNVLPPHVLVDVDPEWSIAKDETFGPVLPIIKARDEAHALELANATEFGLSSCVYTRDLERGVRFARGIEAGMTHVNNMSVGDQPNAPFGGEKNSGLGRFNGNWILEEFTRTHWITVQEDGVAQYPL
ncbi:aldehyde dehydrogenase family protein [Aquamicrobium zhengzhouense]|uniref:Aldehyde dehydrogenase family protein n=1 Tax=Aquamicrobium zhengzhouense TaxID=2781738 RepID=A0ABS0SD78_9HYPH|nr:aldehyde dehydrogenase family protein [Aquamicrobium zhengzhouense]MBI1621253.1 aldehyde dehydrogenase family protein [Aquamicrobium zhengzhouense]